MALTMKAIEQLRQIHDILQANYVDACNLLYRVKPLVLELDKRSIDVYVDFDEYQFPEIKNIVYIYFPGFCIGITKEKYDIHREGKLVEPDPEIVDLIKSMLS